MDKSDPYDNDNERLLKYDKFIWDLIKKEYEFKLGIKFNSLVEFKDDVRDWSILNSRDIRFVMKWVTNISIKLKICLDIISTKGNVSNVLIHSCYIFQLIYIYILELIYIRAFNAWLCICSILYSHVMCWVGVGCNYYLINENILFMHGLM